MGKKPLIIAEAGVNHNGDMALAYQLIDAAAAAKVDYVKFQTFQTTSLVVKNAQKAEYQQKNAFVKEESQEEMLRRLELSPQNHLDLIAYCKQKNIAFLSTAFDLQSIDLLVELGITLGKIPSGEITNFPFLRKMAQSFPHLILSTGMSQLHEIKATLDVLYRFGHTPETVTVLHCNTEYPTPFEDVNLLAMSKLKDELGVRIGYSDHTLGIEVPLAATALGATVIEKHFTLDRNMDGPDHRASLEPQELKAMVEGIERVAVALGSNEKKVSPSEQKNKAVARKSIVAACSIQCGELFTEENLAVKRPGNGISPMCWEEIVGQKANQDYEPDELIQWQEK
ncbi:MAG: N-acetylneuraminate synthase [Spirosomataceae bacterium]